MNYYNYFTEIEEHFVRRRGKHLFVSPMDWSLIATWRDSGVPLHVALRGIDRAMDSYFARKPLRESRLSTLFYCHASVMEEYARHLESHLGEAKDEGEGAGEAAEKKRELSDGPDKNEILALLNARILEIKSLSAKQYILEKVAAENIGRIVGRLEEIARSVGAGREIEYESLDRDLGILDENLIRELRAATDPEQAEIWEQEAKKELKVYRKKLPKETYQKILENYLRARIRRHHGVGELSLFQM
jgi:hypothetical protein